MISGFEHISSEIRDMEKIVLLTSIIALGPRKIKV
jgi:hypothetical protein